MGRGKGKGGAFCCCNLPVEEVMRGGVFVMWYMSIIHTYRQGGSRHPPITTVRAMFLISLSYLMSFFLIYLMPAILLHITSDVISLHGQGRQEAPSPTWQRRENTDVLFLMVFICFWIGMFFVAGVAYKNGEPAR